MTTDQKQGNSQGAAMPPGIGKNCWSERGMPCWGQDTSRRRRDSINGGRNEFPMFETPRRACSVEAMILH